MESQEGGEPVNSRIKQIRTSLDLTQQEFADRLGTPRSNIAGYERGARNPSDGAITAMCKEFGINEDWLRTGEGPMKRSTSREDEIEAMVTNALNGNANLTKAVVQALCNRTEKELAALEALLWDIVYNLQDAKKAQADSQPGRIIKIAGRDGSLEEQTLTDEDANEYLNRIDQLPDAGDDL